MLKKVAIKHIRDFTAQKESSVPQIPDRILQILHGELRRIQDESPDGTGTVQLYRYIERNGKIACVFTFDETFTYMDWVHYQREGDLYVECQGLKRHYTVGVYDLKGERLFYLSHRTTEDGNNDTPGVKVELNAAANKLLVYGNYRDIECYTLNGGFEKQAISLPIEHKSIYDAVFLKDERILYVSYYKGSNIFHAFLYGDNFEHLDEINLGYNSGVELNESRDHFFVTRERGSKWENQRLITHCEISEYEIVL